MSNFSSPPEAQRRDSTKQLTSSSASVKKILEAVDKSIMLANRISENKGEGCASMEAELVALRELVTASLDTVFTSKSNDFEYWKKQVEIKIYPRLQPPLPNSHPTHNLPLLSSFTSSHF
jgi:hypothetical protein